MPDVIRYAIRVTTPNVSRPHYTTRDVGLSVTGNISQYVEDAKTWATEANARKWMESRAQAFTRPPGACPGAAYALGAPDGTEAAALEAEAAVHAAEAARVKKRAARRLAEAQEAKDRIEAYMKRRDADRIDLPLFEFAVVTNGGQRAVEYLVKPADLPEGLRRAEWKPDDKAIRAAVGPDDQVRDDSGNVVARLAQKTTRLELR